MVSCGLSWETSTTCMQCLACHISNRMQIHARYVDALELETRLGQIADSMPHGLESSGLQFRGWLGMVNPSAPFSPSQELQH